MRVTRPTRHRRPWSSRPVATSHQCVLRQSQVTRERWFSARTAPSDKHNQEGKPEAGSGHAVGLLWPGFLNR
jgi:hypothetical protein